MSARIRLLEQPDGRWLMVRVDDESETHRGWVSPTAIVGRVNADEAPGRARRLVDVLAEAIRAVGVEVEVQAVGLSCL